MIAVFKASRYEEIGLPDWLTHTRPAQVIRHLNTDPADLAKFPRNRPGMLSE
ncbi:hypothetical protein [Mesorhizobium sp. GbtcB19]|uniref:hypothetical protein n=1 Tax=Mesorhizobium sp. GbtcB19 TaxID=2824764 RepID=UPI001C2F4076|nr:hypothetical protein [Mesorhizobium sp. GbtcB19]